MILGKLVAHRKSTAWRRFLITSPMTTKKRVCHAILTHPRYEKKVLLSAYAGNLYSATPVRV